MSKAVVYRGADPTEFDEDGKPVGEWENDKEVTGVTIADGVTEIKEAAFHRCKGLTNLSFLKDSAITIIGSYAFSVSGLASLRGVEGVSKFGDFAFANCKDLRTIEGLGCEEMGHSCFAWCTLLQSMKGWPASLTVIPVLCFYGCAGMTTVDCDISHVTSIGADVDGHAFAGCTSLLPPSLSKKDADPAAVLAHLKRKAFLETPAGAAELENAARAAEDSLLAELDAEDAAKKEGKKKKKKKKKASGKKGTQQAEPADWRTEFQRYSRGKSLKETVAELHVSVLGADPPPGANLLAVMEKIEAEFGYVGTGTVGERINNVRLQF
ncbi:hypothetical protein TeGR_g14142 [Tetraparma gracilis]|uniref:Leucine rich repeat protein n=1 Tax=Tetraparma gracilis TaxID=2962635 RepID=A0ABQ6M6P5_9STRA|nr:hypothetical protein TeGR_g14142 [Tetraparma gracilis]